MLGLAAREAEIVGIAPLLPARPLDPRTITAAETARKVAWIREAAGPRYDSLELNIYPVFGPVRVTDAGRAASQEVQEYVKRRFGVELSEEEIVESPHIFIGTVNQLVEKLERTRETYGISYIRVGYLEMKAFAPVVERLAGR